MTGNIPSHLYSIIKDTLQLPIQNYALEICSDFMGEGYTGKLVPIKITHRRSREKQYIVLKYEQTTLGTISKMFDGELLFYSIIWPTLSKFYRKHYGKDICLIPKCFGTCKTKVKAIALENLTACNYQLHDNLKPFDKAHLEMIFKTYGVFHGISLAFKEKHFQKFIELINEMSYQWKNYLNLKDALSLLLCYSAESAQVAFDQITEKQVLTKLREYQEKGPDILVDLLNRYSHKGIFTHGDCWSNNLMFKYSVSRHIYLSSLMNHSAHYAKQNITGKYVYIVDIVDWVEKL